MKVIVHTINNVKVEKYKPVLENFKMQVYRRVREKYSLESLKDVPTFRAYRDFFWKIGIDPTKIRPAAEALIRRILGGKPIPQINTLVDAYNLASIDTEIALAVFDLAKLKGNLEMRFAICGERFLGIGMEKPMTLNGGEIVISDEERLIAVYPYRDADHSKITENSEHVLLLVCGVPGLDEQTLAVAGNVALNYITKFCVPTSSGEL
ncbi:MAG: phenylalanine--tRNA ligase beta subunit-related protein, partial [Candidatus Bathyarchaeia archaeon]